MRKKKKHKTRQSIRELREPYRYISMLSDYGFKKTFGNQGNTLFLKKAIQALIQSPIPITRLKFTRNEHSGTSIDSRGAVFDISCEDEKGNIYIIEMQLREVAHFLQRVKYYSLHTINIMVKKGDYKFDDLKPIYIISFLAENAFPNDHYYQVIQLKNQYGQVMDEQTTYIIVELKKWDMKVEDIKTDLDKLIHVMKATETVTKKQIFSPPPFWEEGWLQTAIKELDLIRMDPVKANNYRVKMVQMAEMERIFRKEIEEETKAIYEKEKLLLEQKAIALKQEKERAEKEKEQVELTLKQEKEQVELALKQEKEQAELALKKKEQEAKQEKITAIKHLLSMKVLKMEQIAQTMQYPIAKVKAIQEEMNRTEQLDANDSQKS